MLNNILIVGIGGFFGSILRYGLLVIFNNIHVAYGVVIVNSLGSFLAGIFFVVISEKLAINDMYRVLLIVGFCGSLTTLSTVSLDSINFLLNNDYRLAISNVIANVVLSFLFAALGFAIARYILPATI